jgi:DedD protein
MEKKKLLFVAISVGAFLSIVIGGAIMLMSPSKSGATSPTVLASAAVVDSVVLPGQSASPAPADPTSLLRGDQASTGLQSPTMAETEPADGDAASDYHISASDAAVDNTATVVITVPKPSVNTSLSTAAPAVPAAKPEPVAAVSTPAPASTVSSPAARESQPSAATTPRTSSQVTPASATVRPQEKSYTAYWVQAGSFNNKTGAENAQLALTDKGITSIIENRTVNGEVWYRVRVGPYTSENEAEFWRKLIVSINGFEQSQIWQNQVANPVS